MREKAPTAMFCRYKPGLGGYANSCANHAPSLRHYTFAHAANRHNTCWGGGVKRLPGEGTRCMLPVTPPMLPTSLSASENTPPKLTSPLTAGAWRSAAAPHAFFSETPVYKG